ncbi:uncharacterized protein BJ171DRAFT_576538 [Polychytrium aggregatum]|uniref:uncharacterized protein n=1 Tax=Polychytrium aggregatum TaxID=110093 RepID=UPI0022FE9D53|nr:uncharacterized protein BJ171DRAFT_576538 [Polychytrium aggregatum]KAI9209753.1 hypothetical protein BJ171DRAFT_576538 [Polychytrium aggregatum]
MDSILRFAHLSGPSLRVPSNGQSIVPEPTGIDSTVSRETATHPSTIRTPSLPQRFSLRDSAVLEALHSIRAAKVPSSSRYEPPRFDRTESESTARDSCLEPALDATVSGFPKTLGVKLLASEQKTNPECPCCQAMALRIAGVCSLMTRLEAELAHVRSDLADKTQERDMLLAEVEQLSQMLFEEANRMVSEERKTASELAQSKAQLERTVSILKSSITAALLFQQCDRQAQAERAKTQPGLRKGISLVEPGSLEAASAQVAAVGSKVSTTPPHAVARE